MRLVIGDNTKKAMSIIGISSYPFGSEELKVKFKVLIKENHPDNGGCKDKASEIIAAFKMLQNLTLDSFSFTAVEEAEGDIFSLKDACPYCKGKGHSNRSFYGEVWDHPKCLRCNGLGKKNEKENCPQCEGSGKHTKTHKRWIVQERFEVVSCTNCSGKGFVVLNPFNPVIPKGAVLS